jgi:hypothetical protein
MNYEHLSFKLKLRKYLLKAPERGVARGLLLNNFRTVPLSVIKTVMEECVSEGTVTISLSRLGAQVYTWREEAVKLEVSRG